MTSAFLTSWKLVNHYLMLNPPTTWYSNFVVVVYFSGEKKETPEILVYHQANHIFNKAATSNTVILF